MLNILHVMRPAEGGMKQHVLALLKNLDRSKYNIFLTCPNPSEWYKNLKENKVEVIELQLKGEISPLSDINNILKLCNIIKKHDIHIIHAHGMKASFIGRVAAKISTRPSISTVHNSVYTYSMPNFKKQILAKTQGILAKHTTQFITVSEALREEISEWEKVNQKNVKVIYNGIPVEAFQKKKSPFIKVMLGLNPALPVVGTIARLAPQKGVIHFIRAAFLVSKVVSESQFLVVGDGPLKKDIKNEVDKLGMKNKIVFVDNYPDITNIYPLIDVFVVPSISEGLSITTLEAMASARPIVASKTGGIPELISHRSTGLLVPPGDHQILAQSILALLKRPKWAERMSIAAQKKSQNKFNMGNMVRQTDEIYMEIANEFDGKFI